MQDQDTEFDDYGTSDYATRPEVLFGNYMVTPIRHERTPEREAAERSGLSSDEQSEGDSTVESPECFSSTTVFMS